MSFDDACLNAWITVNRRDEAKTREHRQLTSLHNQPWTAARRAIDRKIIERLITEHIDYNA